MTQQEFEQLPKQQQQLRWELFLATDGQTIAPTNAKALEILRQLNCIKNTTTDLT